MSQLVDSKSVQDIPLGDRRTMNLLRITGAAVFVHYDTGARRNFSLARGRTQSQMFWIDGGTGQNMRLGIGQVDTDPPVEVVQEVKVLANNYSAEYGDSVGGVIIATTRSGSNEFHGSAFEYLRNDALDAASWRRSFPAPSCVKWRPAHAVGPLVPSVHQSRSYIRRWASPHITRSPARREALLPRSQFHWHLHVVEVPQQHQ
ncbi:MAG TPA: hypothetical protein VFL57_18975 [Bryobacteraceae bacterium]|nr:hypothetical protein [Bryobacteraceae bacterium]